ncbi:MAG: N-acyl homoserine lactonase family protein [Planctomycetota bacterium]|jgi:glyoxylase-like metal-dependent hydrolase (beta-lactamase superfamily II)|nr:N-acyl homoserine lactonase family protein [Planctomycetota bacterium]
MPKLTIRPLNTGHVPTNPFQYHYHHSVQPFLKDVPNEKVPLPVVTYLVEGGGKLLLVDTGMAPTERANKYHHPGSWQEEGQDIESRLKAAGHKTTDVDIVVFTHLHWDHMFFADKFAHARLVAHRRELDFARNPIPLYYKSYEFPALGIAPPIAGLNIQMVEGETEIMEGVRVFESFGHSPGHMSVEVDCADGDKYICAGDSIFVLGNLNPVPELHYDITPPGRFYNIVEAWRAIASQKARAKSLNHLLLCHDIKILDRIKENPIIGGKK